MSCRKVLILRSAVFSLNVAIAEPSRSETECQANLDVDIIEYVIRGGEDLADGGQRARKQDEFDGSINCKQLIDGYFLKKVFLIAKNRPFILVNQTSLLRQECLLPIAVHDGIRNELLVMAAEGAVVSSCGTSCMQI